MLRLKHHCLRTCVFLVHACAVILFLAEKATAFEAVPARNAVVVASERCSAKIGEGGNLRSGRVELEGKCEGSGQPVILKSNDPGERSLQFKVNSKDKSSKDRAELAFTRERFKFGQEYFIGFEIKIPAGSDVTASWYYLVQFWQGGNRPPLAGLRMNRGASHTATVMARGEGNAKGDAITGISLPPGQWVKLALKLNVKPTGHSCVAVWQVNKSPEQWCGQMGYPQDGTLKNWYRMKFGIYKDSEPGKTFYSEFRSIRIGQSLQEVWH